MAARADDWFLSSNTPPPRLALDIEFGMLVIPSKAGPFDGGWEARRAEARLEAKRRAEPAEGPDRRRKDQPKVLNFKSFSGLIQAAAQHALD